jgi:hypothetical protein
MTPSTGLERGQLVCAIANIFNWIQLLEIFYRLKMFLPETAHLTEGLEILLDG